MNPRSQHRETHRPLTPLTEEEPLAIGDLLAQPPVVINGQAKVRNADLLALDLGVHHLAVVDIFGAPLGTVCRCDLREADPELAVFEVMHGPPLTLDFHTPLTEVADAMARAPQSLLLVLDGSLLTGVLTKGDLLRAGVLAIDDRPRCAACGQVRHVRPHPEVDSGLCLDCLGKLPPAFSEGEESRYDLGGGD